jgi:hypothetical protein
LSARDCGCLVEIPAINPWPSQPAKTPRKRQCWPPIQESSRRRKHWASFRASYGGPFRYAASARHPRPDTPHPRISTLCIAHQRATKALASVASAKQIARASFTTPRVLVGGRGPPISTTIGVQPSVHLIEPVAESFGRNADPDPDRKPVFGVPNSLLRGSHEVAPR